MAFNHVLPPTGVRRGPRPLEYQIMGRLEEIIARMAQRDPNELLTIPMAAQEAECNHQYFRNAINEGRGPEPTPVGRRIIFRRGAVVAWLKFLAKHKRKLAA